MKKRKERIEAELLGIGQNVIVEELSKLPKFRQRMQELARRYPDIASIKDFEYPLDIMIANGTLKHDEPDIIERVKVYTDTLREVADTFNLRCGWIIPGLHYMVVNIINPDIMAPISNYSMRWKIDEILLRIPIYTDTTRDDIQPLLDKEWKRIKSRHPELQMRARIPESFEQHVKWLCDRLFRGGTGYTIDTERLFDPDYINVSIRKAARVLGITLPRGRPPKVNKR